MPCLPEVMAGRQALEQIFLNLIINGVQAIDHENGIVEVNTAITEVAGSILVEVADNGCGISKKIADYIFDPFVTDKPAGRRHGIPGSIAGTSRRKRDVVLWKSCYGRSSIRKELEALGNCYYLQKPLAPHHLVQLVDMVQRGR